MRWPERFLAVHGSVRSESGWKAVEIEALTPSKETDRYGGLDRRACTALRHPLAGRKQRSTLLEGFRRSHETIARVIRRGG